MKNIAWQILHYIRYHAHPNNKYRSEGNWWCAYIQHHLPWRWRLWYWTMWEEYTFSKRSK